jgi:excisionase family DNA binding protein
MISRKTDRMGTETLKVTRESTVREDEPGYQQPELLSVSEASRSLGLHRNTIYKLIQEGEIPAFRLTRGGRWRFKRGDLEEWLRDKQAVSQR